MRLSGGQLRATARCQRSNERRLPQNGIGYESGLEQAFWKPVRDLLEGAELESEAIVGQALALQAIRCQHVHGLPDPGVVSPGRSTAVTLSPRVTFTTPSETSLRCASEGHCDDRITAGPVPVHP
jgi:hypothetical protein